MSWAEEQAFIERQITAYHSFLDEMWFYKRLADGIAANAGFSSYSVTVSYSTNFRDTFWHYSKALNHLNDANETSTQYRMMLEHLNRAVVDLLVNVLQKLYHMNRLIAYSCCQSLCSDDIKAKYALDERKRVERRFTRSKNGYLAARKTLLMLRCKRSSLYRLVSAPSEFNTPAEYADNTVYFTEVISLFAQSYEFLYTAIINT